MEKRWLTLANGLSLVRLLLIVPSCVAVVGQHFAAAAVMFAVAVITDLADGPVARSRGQATPLGGLIDHSVDAAYVTAMLGALAVHDAVPALLPWLVATAFVQYMLDSKALRGRTLRASRLGRMNGIAYFALVGTAVIRDALGLSFPSDPWLVGGGWCLVATTVVSMSDRLLALLRRDPPPELPGD